MLTEATPTLMSSVLPYDPHPYPHEGTAIEVVRGPLAGSARDSPTERETALAGARRSPDSPGRAVEIDVSDVVPA